jgi:hypothetical protein
MEPAAVKLNNSVKYEVSKAFDLRNYVKSGLCLRKFRVSRLPKGKIISCTLRNSSRRRRFYAEKLEILSSKQISVKTLLLYKVFL